MRAGKGVDGFRDAKRSGRHAGLVGALWRRRMRHRQGFRLQHQPADARRFERSGSNETVFFEQVDEAPLRIARAGDFTHLLLN
jgi:hypothetical protein